MTRTRDSWLYRVLAGLIWLVAALGPGSVLAQGDDEDLDLGEEDAPAAAEEGESEDESAPADDSEEPADPVEPAEPAGRGIAVSAYAGAGASTRTYERPTDNGAQAIEASIVPAVEVGMGVNAWPDADFSLAFDLRYQTALGLTVTERPPFALPNELAVRSERVELTIAPSWRLGTSPSSPRIAVPIGASVRTFWPEAHGYMTPGYSLVAPQVRLELVAVLAGPLSVRLGPELQWIIAIDEMIRSQGVDRQGFALGGELTLSLELTQVWSVAVHFRESHAFASSTGDVSFEDVERYLTARLTGMF